MMADHEGAYRSARKLFAQHAETMLGKIMLHSSLLTFVYFPKTRRYEILNLPGTLGTIPMMADRFPDSLFEHIRMSSADKQEFRASIRKLEQGAREVDFTVQINSGGAGVWLENHWTCFFDKKDNPDYVLGIGIDVTDKMEREKSFADQMLMREAAQSSIMFASCFNVTKDTVVRQNREEPETGLPTKPPCSEEMRLAILADEPEVLNQSPETQYSFFWAVAQLPDPEERRRFAHLCSHVGMLESFREGRTEQTMNYSRLVNGVLSYVSTRLVLLADPQTQDVYAFFYTVDISEKKRDELVIDTVMHQSCDFVALIDPDTDTATFRFMSDTVRAVAPYWADGAVICYSQMMDRAVSLLIDPERQADIATMISVKNIVEHLQEESPYYCSYDFQENGKQAHKQVQYRWLHDTHKSILVVQQDVTATWEAEQERMRKERENESILNQLALKANDFVSIIDAATARVSLRTGTWYALGTDTPPEQRDMDIDDLFHEVVAKFLPDAEQYHEFWNQVNLDHVLSVLEEAPEYVTFYDFVGADGKPKRKQCRYSWLDREAGKILYVRTDITKSYEKDRQIELDDQLLKTIMLDTVDVIALLDPASGQFTLRFGNWLSREHATSTSERIISYDDFLELSAAYVAEEDLGALRKTFSLDEVLRGLERENELDFAFDFGSLENPTRIYKKRIHYSWLTPQHTLILFSRTDVTKSVEEERERNRRLSDALDAAEQANLAKTEFLSRMSHDIRTPMNAIIGFSTLLLKDSHDPDKVANEARKVLTSSNHLLGLINDVLDMSRIESGSMRVNTRAFRLADALATVDGIMRPQMEAKEQSFDIYICDIGHDSFEADDNRLQQSLINILGNATKYTQFGGRITMKIRSLPATSSAYENVVFEIKDNGRGISEEFQRVLFSPFTRENLLGTEDAQGTGLGLAITKNIVNIMGGTIAVKSKVGEGSTFTLVFPLRIQDKDMELDFWERHSAIHMLAVDDDELVCRNIVDAMSRTGIDLDTATNGASALETLKAAHTAGNEYTLVLLDWKMPEMDGIEIARRIRAELPADIQIIILTAYDYSAIEAEARAAGVDAFLQKPFFTSSLQAVLKTLESSYGQSLIAADTGMENPAKSVLSGLNVLAAEDNALNAEVLTEILKANGAHTVIAPNGKRVLEAFAQSEPGAYDVILMDVQMPLMNGYEATTEIRSLVNEMRLTSQKREEATRIPIIAMTADAFNEDVQKALLSGMDAHVAKPLDIDVLRTTLAQVIALKKPE